MNLIPWKRVYDPFSELEGIQQEMNRLFDFSRNRTGDRQLGLLESRWRPALDIYDSKDQIMVKVDIPGMDKKDIDISIHGDTLVIRGEKKEEKEVKEKGFVRTERFYGSFHRAVTLPAPVDDKKAIASYKNGVLELTLPKKEGAKPKQIKIDVK